MMKNIFLSVIVMFMLNQGFGQSSVYDAELDMRAPNVRTYLSYLDMPTVIRRNKVGGHTVVEIYEQGVGTYLGFWADTSAFDLNQLPLLQHRRHKKLIKRGHSVASAIAMYNKSIATGISVRKLDKQRRKEEKLQSENKH